ncbi:MAG: conjugative transfer signal peptidase TraF [Candidatus Binataceae bacterium]
MDEVLGVGNKWGNGRSFVEQDKASAVQCRRSAGFSNIRTAFPPLQGIRIGQLHSTAKSTSEPVAPGLHFKRFRHPHRPILAMLGSVVALALLVVLASVLGLRISPTDSAAPAGIYRITPDVAVERGQLVGACLPASIAREGLARGYLRRGDCPGGAEPVAKMIGALPGDVLEVQPAGVSVDGETFADSAVAARDSIARPLPHVPWGSRQVAPGEVWLFGFHNARSWDARYFGPVPLSGVQGVLKPILTW